MVAPHDPQAPSPIEISSGLPAISPDLAEQDLSDGGDQVIPMHGYDALPVVGLGGSAGSLAPLQDFFQHMRCDSGMAFVVVTHLSPEYASTMPEILQRATEMRVTAALHGDKLAPNHVYVIPPGKHLTVTDGHLRLSDLEPEKGRRVAVDLFFRSLADTHGPRASVVVLSGADSDGTIGLKRIKERGGLTVSQDPVEAEHQGMPRSAIATGMVDWVLPVAQMPARILEYYASEYRLLLPSEEGPQPARPIPPPPDASEAALREVLVFMRTRTGCDFSYYKRATIVRRISRRMQVNSVDDLPQYLAFLRLHPGETGALLQDLLISVTNFFRDREAFAALETHVPALFAGKSQGDAVRVWVPACATGEEAYSLAMLLLEHARTLEAPPAIQVFGCDLDEQAIQMARTGVYPDAIAADVSDERLRRFFTKDHRGYRVSREMREMVLFAAHDLLKDAPFSRMDLISCRNLMIYLNREAQTRALETFHFAMKPAGRLFLGSSESIDEDSTLFHPLDKKYRIFRHLNAARVGMPVPTGPSTLLRAIEAQHGKLVPVLPGRAFTRNADVPFAPTTSGLDERISLGELHFKLLERFAPPSAIVDQHHVIVHLSENAGRFLQFSGGEPTADLLQVVHPVMRVELRAALFRAGETNASVKVSDLPVEIDGQMKAVDLTVSPARELAPGYLLVVFDAHDLGMEADLAGTRLEPEPVVRHLERELEQVKSHLRDTVEQYEAGTEELKASNEELQAMNEELRSATEELETGREELQSINEELTAVNLELKAKVDELGQVNSDLHNLMASTAIATVFLDRELQVMRYTPAAVSLFHLIPGDVGRPLADLKISIEYPGLVADLQAVLARLVPLEREVTDAEHRWFLARLLPYRTLEDHIGGVVLTFVEITALKRAENALRESQQDLAAALALARIGSFRLNPATGAVKSDEVARAIYGLPVSDAVTAEDMMEVVHPEDREMLAAKIDRTRKDGTPLEAEHRVVHVEKGVRWALIRGGRAWLPNGGAEIYIASLDVTKRRLAEEELRVRNDELERFNRVAVDREVRMVELKKEINALRVRMGEEIRYRPDPE